MHDAAPATASGLIQVRVATPSGPCASSEAERWGCARRDRTRCGTSTRPSSACSTGPASARRHRQLLSTDSGVARGRHVRTREQRGRAARGQSGCATRSTSAPIVFGGRGVENVSAQVDALIATGVLRRLLAFNRAEVLQLDDRAWWRSIPRTQPRASTFGVSGTDARRDSSASGTRCRRT